MLPHLLYRSLLNRPGRAILVVIAITMGVSLGAAMLNLFLEVGGNSSRELRAYGANVLLVPREDGSGSAANGLFGLQGYIPQDQLGALKDQDIACCLEGYAPFLYTVVSVNGQETVLAGTRLDDAGKISPWWKIEGEAPAPEDKSAAILGTSLARRLNLGPGDAISLEVAGARRDLNITGTLTTGGSEDNQVLVELDLAQSLSSLSRKVSAAQVSVITENRSAEEMAAILGERIPAAQAKTVRQVTQAEENLVAKINLLMGLVTGLIIIVSGLTVGASLTNAVIERRRDIGLMKSLGAEGRRIAAIILVEVGILGVTAGVAGYLLGLAIARVIGFTVFDAAVSPHLLVMPAALLAALAIAFLSALLPVRQALSVEPAVILRGE